MAISNEQLLAAIKKNPIVTACVVVVLGVVAGIYFRGDLKPQAEVELEELSKQSRRMSANIKNSSLLDEHLGALTNHAAEIDRRLISSGALAVNLQYFYELEAATGTKLVDLRQIATGNGRVREREQVKQGAGAYEPVGFAVALIGTYPQLVDFLQRLEGGEHFCRIQSASFTPAASENSGPTLGRPDTLTLVLDLELLGQP